MMKKKVKEGEICEADARLAKIAYEIPVVTMIVISLLVLAWPFVVVITFTWWIGKLMGVIQ